MCCSTMAATNASTLLARILEEDAGKSLHEDFQDMTGIDLNRAGTPLLKLCPNPICARQKKRSLI